jgi:hypothetical protein
MLRIGLMYQLSCIECGASFSRKRPDAKYCSFRCTSKAHRRRHQIAPRLLDAGRDCQRCGHHFEVVVPNTNRRYCSPDCSAASAREQRRSFHKRKPGVQKIYNSRRLIRDNGLISRLRRRYPGLPTACESCGESRVLEVAHRPEFRRNGAWRKIENSRPHMIWILCPTCHELLDREISSPEELRLSDGRQHAA